MSQFESDLGYHFTIQEIISIIKEFAHRFVEIEKELKASFFDKFPNGYEDILQRSLESMYPESEASYGKPNYSNIHRIDDGDYQGTLVFMVPERCYQPDTYWVFKVGYGSCSVCDTFERIDRDCYDYGNGVEDGCKEQQVNDFYTLALHMIQSAVEV